ncbi:GNAT family N-acetyltransferase [Microbacterium sp. GXF7504]
MIDPSQPDEDVRVVRDDEHDRYRVEVDGQTAGFTAFRRDGERLRFVHTEVDEAYSGRGLAKTLVAQAMADVADRGETVVPLCPYVASFLRRTEVPGLKVHWPAGSEG